MSMNRWANRCRRARAIAAVCAAAACGATVFAAAPSSAASSGFPSGAGAEEKRQYHLFNPVPRRLMREMSTDRPDITESPYTLDAGHFQAELSFLEYGRDDDAGGDIEELAIFPTNLKVGLLNNVDLQLVFTPYINVDVDGATASGFGETQLRLKVNLWGNDGPHEPFGDTALGIMPFVQFPTGDEDLGFADEVEGGVIVPFATPLPHDFALALMAEFDLVRDEDDDGYELEFVHTASVGRDLVGDLAGYVEYIGVAGSGDYAAALGAGVTYGLTPDVQLDAGLIVGLNDAAEDVRVFTGLSFRL